MSKLKIPLIIFLLLIPVFTFLIFLFRAGVLPNPLKDVEPENPVLSSLVGAVSNLLGSTPSSHEGEDESIKEEFAKLGYPAELFSFDVTSQPAVFAIVDVDLDEKTMVLQYILPFDRQGQTIKSVINCSTEESTVMILDQNSNITDTSVADRPLYELATENIDTLQGICNDLECSSIVGNCELLKSK